jgi:hypothetical protein
MVARKTAGKRKMLRKGANGKLKMRRMTHRISVRKVKVMKRKASTFNRAVGKALKGRTFASAASQKKAFTAAVRKASNSTEKQLKRAAKGYRRKSATKIVLKKVKVSARKASVRKGRKGHSSVRKASARRSVRA